MNAIQNHLVRKKRQRSKQMADSRYIPMQVQEGITLERNISYIRDGTREHMLDLYCPMEKGPFPIVIYVHGDLMSGRKETCSHFCMDLCRKGFVVCAINYRLSPETGLTEKLQDLADAAQYIRKKSEEMNMQADNMFLAGDGAGAMLCYYLLAIQKEPELEALLQIQNTQTEFAAAAYISGPIYQQKFWQRLVSLSWPGGQKFRNYPYIKTDNPILVEHQPPTFFVSAYADPGHRELIKLIVNYQTMGKVRQTLFLPSDSDYYTGLPILDPELPDCQEIIREMADFFNKWRINKTYERTV